MRAKFFATYQLRFHHPQQKSNKLSFELSSNIVTDFVWNRLLGKLYTFPWQSHMILQPTLQTTYSIFPSPTDDFYLLRKAYNQTQMFACIVLPKRLPIFIITYYQTSNKWTILYTLFYASSKCDSNMVCQYVYKSSALHTVYIHLFNLRW